MYLRTSFTAAAIQPLIIQPTDKSYNRIQYIACF